MTSSEHPSFLVQDRWALGLEVGGEARVHLEACPACRARAESVVGSTEAVPDWARALATVPVRRRVAGWQWTAAAGAVAAAAVLLFLLVAPPQRSALRTTTTVRGAPSVGVYVARGARVSLWDGRQPINPGDRLRLKIVAEGYTHVTVFAPDERGRLHVLHGARVDPANETTLATAWRVDDAPGDELLVVVLAARAVRADEVPGPGEGRRAGLWVRRLRLPKRVGGAR